MAKKESVLSTAKTTSSAPIKKTSSAPTKTVAPPPHGAAAPKVDDSQKYKDAIAEIARTHEAVLSSSQNRNYRVAFNEAVQKAKDLL